jgi:hypothetical protein
MLTQRCRNFILLAGYMLNGLAEKPAVSMESPTQHMHARYCCFTYYPLISYVCISNEDIEIYNLRKVCATNVGLGDNIYGQWFLNRLINLPLGL